MDVNALIKKLDEALLTIEELREENRQLKERIAVLEKDSSTSSKPPSSDITKPKRKKSGKKKKGGQIGHKGSSRKLLPIEAVDNVVEHKLSSCPECGKDHDLSEAKSEKVLRHQTFELPDKPIVVTEHRCYRTWCKNCKMYHYAKLPDLIKKQGIFGPKLSGHLGYLKGQFGASYSSLSEYCSDALGVKVSRSLICNTIKKVSRALKSPYEEIGESLNKQENLHIDETSWKDNGESYWMWVFCNISLAYFIITKSRSTQVLKDVLGKVFEGVIISDFYSAYVCYANAKQQFCLAHLIRDVKFLTTLPDEESKLFGEKLLRYFKRLFELWHERESLAPEEFAKKTDRLKREIFTYLTNANIPEKGKAKNMRKRLSKHWNSIFLFLQYDGKIEPTNNAGEQTIRHMVIMRKLSQGTRSSWGREWNARVATVLATCRKQALSPYHFIVESVKAHQDGKPSPSLVF